MVRPAVRLLVRPTLRSACLRSAARLPCTLSASTSLPQRPLRDLAVTSAAHLQGMVKQAKTGLAVGIAKGHVVTVREQKQRPAQRKGVSASVQQRCKLAGLCLSIVTPQCYTDTPPDLCRGPAHK